MLFDHAALLDNRWIIVGWCYQRPIALHDQQTQIRLSARHWRTAAVHYRLMAL